jgi:hypothetical protein
MYGIDKGWRGSHGSAAAFQPCCRGGLCVCICVYLYVCIYTYYVCLHFLREAPGLVVDPVEGEGSRSAALFSLSAGEMELTMKD